MTDGPTEVHLEKKSRTWWWIGGGVIALLVISAASGGGGANRTTPNPATASASVTPTEPIEAAGPVNDPGITMAEFSRLTTGMSEAEAATIVGSEGEVQSESELAGIHTVMRGWKGESGFGGNANAMFQDGKLISKAQAMLK